MSAAAVAQARLSESVGQLGNWARQGFQSFAAAQRILLDLTAQQNALAIGVLRERVRIPQIHPGDTMADAADRGVAGLTSAGKILLDLAAGETELVFEAVKEGLRLPPAAGAMTDVVRHRLETIIEMHRRLLDATAQQTHAAVESYKEGEGLQVGTRALELTRSGIEGFVSAEKKFLDLAAEEVTAATAGAKDTRKPGKSRTKALAQLARTGVEKFAEAQKQLLVLAIDQAEAALKPSPERGEEENMEPRTSFADLTQKTVQNFVTAQKSLMDLAVKPLRKTPPPMAKRAGPRPRHKR